ncbi:hypothetical protein [Salinibacterium xinjiangense]|nr:hypothetical protein [Salinibacterium xinjiangense]
MAGTTETITGRAVRASIVLRVDQWRTASATINPAGSSTHGL